MISCAAPNVNIALAVGPTFLIPLMLFGGLFLQNSTIPVWLEWLKYLSWFMYSNEAMLINQWKGVDDIKVGDLVIQKLFSLKPVFTRERTTQYSMGTLS